MDLKFDLHMEPQPTEVTCGPTCLHCIYRHLGLEVDLQKVIDDIDPTPEEGTLGVNLGLHALAMGFEVTIYTHNLQVFDPTWFRMSVEEKKRKLKAQADFKKSRKNQSASLHYFDFLDRGGQIRWVELTKDFVYDLVNLTGPVIVGLSATYLYWASREYGVNCEHDDVRGRPQGHFVVLNGIFSDKERVLLTDPYQNNPLSQSQSYEVSMSRLINSTLIGAITYDANFIQISRKLL